MQKLMVVMSVELAFKTTPIILSMFSQQIQASITDKVPEIQHRAKLIKVII
jgi:hypothetical protein